MGDAAAKLRFFQAIGEWARRGNRGAVSVLVDDLKYLDPASTEVGQHLISSVFKAAQPQPRLLCALRSGEAWPLEHFFEAAAQAGLVALVNLEPLDEEGIEGLVASLAPDQPGLGARLYRSTGGNPFFAVETLRALAQRGDWSGPLPLAERVASSLEARLARLSTGALRRARAGAPPWR